MVETTENGDEGRYIPYPCPGVCSPPKGEIAARSRAGGRASPATFRCFDRPIQLSQRVYAQGIIQNRRNHGEWCRLGGWL